MAADAPRYAIYLAPEPDTALWRFGSRVLGYDASSGETIAGYAPQGFTPESWRQATARPRTYGFHATLKAPFRLAEGQTLSALQARLDELCASRLAFSLGQLAVTTFASSAGKGFAALTPIKTPPELEQLEQVIVAGLDVFRAPLTAADIAKRKPETLTPRQREALMRFGYPHTGPDYHFHMTLSGEMDAIAGVARALSADLKSEVTNPQLGVDSCWLYGQDGDGKPFRMISRSRLGATK
jgi:2'-5' RNA ligase